MRVYHTLFLSHLPTDHYPNTGKVHIQSAAHPNTSLRSNESDVIASENRRGLEYWTVVSEKPGVFRLVGHTGRMMGVAPKRSLTMAPKPAKNTSWRLLTGSGVDKIEDGGVYFLLDHHDQKLGANSTGALYHTVLAGLREKWVACVRGPHIGFLSKSGWALTPGGLLSAVFLLPCASLLLCV